MIGLIDLTDLADRTDESATVELCRRAQMAGTAAVCVWPDFVARAAAEVAGTGVRVATVVNFPTGDERAHAVGVLTERAVDDGADEIDVVLPYRALLTGDRTRAAEVLDTVRSAAAGTTVKTILETGELPAEEVATAARFAIDHGADFVKTSTGKTPVSATVEAVRSMLEVIADTPGRRIGIKPSGGISTAADAERYLGLAEEIMGPTWPTPQTFRFGTSRLLDALLAM